MRRTSAADRFFEKVDLSLFCWRWLGARSSTGYGTFEVSRDRVVSPHRFAYELLVGSIPDGLVLDHLCRNRLCVNPNHLEPVTNAENVRFDSSEGLWPWSCSPARPRPASALVTLAS